MTTVPEQLPADIELAERHRKLLEASAVDVNVALEAGVRTVSAADELPEDLAWAAKRLPGLIFAHHRVDDTQDPVPQLRPDDPGDDDDAPKYLLPAGSGAVISCHPRMVGRIGQAKKAIVVEGTKQYLAAVSSAPDDWLVVGIQGCQGWMHDGVPVPDLDEIVRGAEVTVIFDADLGSNRNVWDAASRLSEHLRAVGATKVSWAFIPAGGTSGLDDWLAGRPPEHRQEALSGLVAHAADKLPRAPARQKVTVRSMGTTVPWVDEASGVIRGPDIPGERAALPGPVLLGAIARIVETELEIDDLDPDPGPQRVSHRLVVSASGVELPVKVPIADEKLPDPAFWLAQTPDAAGLQVVVDAGPRTGVAVAGAIRRYSVEDRRAVAARTRTGWVDTDEHGPTWIHRGGGISASGAVINYRGNLATPIRLPDDALARDPVDAAKVILETADNLHDPLPWWAMVGLAFWSFAGGTPKGSILLRGGQGSGKSSLTACIAAMENPIFAPDGEVMASADATDAGAAVQGQGVHHAVVVVDDFHDPRAIPLRQAYSNRLDSLMRRGYSGQTAGRNKATLSDQHRVVAAKQDHSRPAVIVSADWVPDLVPSAIDRLCVIDVSKASTWVPGGYDLAREWGRSGRYAAALAHFLKWVAVQIAEEGGVAEWNVAIERESKAQVAALTKALGPEAFRHREVLAPVFGGLRLCRGWLAETLGPEAVELLDRAAVDTVRRLADSRRASEIDSDSAADILNKLKSKISAGDLFLVEPDVEARPGARCVGRRMSLADGTEVVAIIREQAAAATNESVSTIHQAFQTAGILVEGKNHELLHNVRIRGEQGKRWLIRRDHWDASGRGAPAAPPVVSPSAPVADEDFGPDDWDPNEDAPADDPMLAAIIAGIIDTKEELQ